MNKHQNNSSRLCAIVGAGDLVSHVRQTQDVNLEPRYRFNLMRLKANVDVTGSFRPDDLRDIIKVCQVIAFEIASDGWLPEQRQELLDLATGLDALTQSWERTHEE
jgi:hypothetical protein